MKYKFLLCQKDDVKLVTTVQFSLREYYLAIKHSLKVMNINPPTHKPAGLRTRVCVPQIAFLDSHSAPKASDLTTATAGAGAATTTRTLPRTIELLIISIFINEHVVGEGEGEGGSG